MQNTTVKTTKYENININLLYSVAFLNLQDDFIFTKGNQKVILKINDGERNVYWNKTSTLNLKLENIEKEKVTLSAPGITYKKVQNKKDELELEITPNKEIFQNDSLKLNFGYHDNKNKYVHHEFLILIK